MNLLLDTSVFLYFITNDAKLPNRLRVVIEDANNTVYLSVVSFWEIAVKYQLGKLPLPASPETLVPDQCQLNNIMSLQLNASSVCELHKLPTHHRDPFDRMLVCQTLAHNLTLMTTDTMLMRYPVSVLS